MWWYVLWELLMGFGCMVKVWELGIGVWCSGRRFKLPSVRTWGVLCKVWWRCERTGALNTSKASNAKPSKTPPTLNLALVLAHVGQLSGLTWSRQCSWLQPQPSQLASRIRYLMKNWRFVCRLSSICRSYVPSQFSPLPSCKVKCKVQSG